MVVNNRLVAVVPELVSAPLLQPVQRWKIESVDDARSCSVCKNTMVHNKDSRFQFKTSHTHLTHGTCKQSATDAGRKGGCALFPVDMTGSQRIAQAPCSSVLFVQDLALGPSTVSVYRCLRCGRLHALRDSSSWLGRCGLARTCCSV